MTSFLPGSAQAGEKLLTAEDTEAKVLHTKGTKGTGRIAEGRLQIEEVTGDTGIALTSRQRGKSF
jgi:hypothetical protein